MTTTTYLKKSEIRTREGFNGGWVAVLEAFGLEVRVFGVGKTEADALAQLKEKLKEIST